MDYEWDIASGFISWLGAIPGEWRFRSLGNSLIDGPFSTAMSGYWRVYRGYPMDYVSW